MAKSNRDAVASEIMPTMRAMGKPTPFFECQIEGKVFGFHAYLASIELSHPSVLHAFHARAIWIQLDLPIVAHFP